MLPCHRAAVGYGIGTDTPLVPVFKTQGRGQGEAVEDEDGLAVEDRPRSLDLDTAHFVGIPQLRRQLKLTEPPIEQLPPPAEVDSDSLAGASASPTPMVYFV